ncbi:MAG: LPS sulfotransferase NodH [Kiritimatiellia bacterium]|jgi:LPS sulfotransferase NodH
MLLDPRNSPHFDLPAHQARRRTYVIASTPRSGSTLFARALWDTGLIGAPKEYLNPMQIRDWEVRLAPTWTRRVRHRALRGALVGVAGKVRFDDERLREHLDRVRDRRTGPTGWFGLKLHQHHAQRWFLQRDLDTWLRPVVWFRVRREDRLAQALSWARAEWTGRWTHGDRGWTPPLYSRRRIRAALARVDAQNAAWNLYFSNRDPPMEIRYHDLVHDLSGCVHRALRSLGVHAQVNVRPPTLQPQADDLTQQWRRRYLEGR